MTCVKDPLSEDLVAKWHVSPGTRMPRDLLNANIASSPSCSPAVWRARSPMAKIQGTENKRRFVLFQDHKDPSKLQDVPNQQTLYIERSEPLQKRLSSIPSASQLSS